MIDKLMQNFRKKAQTQHVDALEVYKQKLKGILYDEELVEEFAPIFAKLSQNEGFDKVFELIENKERQIEAVTGGEWKTTKDAEEDQSFEMNNPDKQQPKTQSAEEILAARFK